MKINEQDKEILKHLAEGLTEKEVAAKVYMSREGLRDRLVKLRKKSGCKNTLQLVVKCVNLNLL